jgi:hypothetical protein
MSARTGFLLPALLLSLASCEGPAGQAAPAPGDVPVDPGTPADVGSFQMSLTVGGGVQLSEVSYDISGNGFHKAGTINVANSASVATVIGGIPFGTGYALALTAQDAGHQLTGCSGSATFDIPNATTVQVPVHLICHEQPRVAVQAVPVPPWARFVLAAALLAAGVGAARRRARRTT